MIYFLEPSKVVVNIRLNYRGTPDENDCVASEEVTVGGVGDIVKLLCWHTIVLT